jgi:hypothetical protein
VSRYRRRAAVAAALVVGVVPALSACGAGNNAVTLKPYAPSDGSQATVGTNKILDAVVVVPVSETAGEVSTTGVVSTVIANSDTVSGDTVESFTINGSSAATAGDLTVPRWPGLLRFVPPSDLASPTPTPDTNTGVLVQASAEFRNLTVKPGDIVDMTVMFRRAGKVTLPVPIETATDYYASITPGPQGTSANPSASPSPSATP